MKEVSICCGCERSEIYPRDCWKCGGLFIAKKTAIIKQRKYGRTFVQEIMKKLGF